MAPNRQEDEKMTITKLAQSITDAEKPEGSVWIDKNGKQHTHFAGAKLADRSNEKLAKALNTAVAGSALDGAFIAAKDNPYQGAGPKMPYMSEDEVAKIGPKEAMLRAARADDLKIPEALDRTKGMTKEELNKLHDKLSKPTKVGAKKIKPTPPVKPSAHTEADKKAIAEIRKSEAAKAEEKKKANLAKLKAANAEKKAVKDAAKASKAAGKPAGAPSPRVALDTATAKKPASDAPKPAKKPSKMDLATELLKTKGATQVELHALTGWKYTNVKELAARAKMKLSETDGRFRLV